MDSWIEFGTTKSGGWIIAIEVDAGRSLSDPWPPPSDEPLFLVGVSHYKCMQAARAQIRGGQVGVAEDASIMYLDEGNPDEMIDFSSNAKADECPFCQYSYSPLSKEDVYPRWLLRELTRRGARARDARGKVRSSLPRLIVPICMDCNNTWMSVLENNASSILLAINDETRDIDSFEQRQLAFWAEKTAFLLDLASGDSVIPRGFAHSMKIHRRPHPGVHVWIAAYNDGSDVLAVERWRIMAEQEDAVIAQCITFTVGRVIFQVLFPNCEGDLSPLEDFEQAVLQIWPPKDSLINWPPPWCFDRNSLKALAKRIYDNRDPVIMDVTLQAATRSRPEALPKMP